MNAEYDQKNRARLLAALAKRDPEYEDDYGCLDKDPVFDPWDDIVNISHGTYSSQSDDLMVEALIAVRDKTHTGFMEKWGFAGEFALYVLSSNNLTNYGTSPRYGWIEETISDLLPKLIEKWETYRLVRWSDD